MIGSPPNDYRNWDFWQGGAAYLADFKGSDILSVRNYNNPPEISTDGEVGLIWRYDDCNLYPLARSGCMQFDPSGKMGLWNYEWNFAVSNAADINLILLYSWNEYNERSAFEPHTDITAGNFSGTRDIAGLIQGLESAPLFRPDIPEVFMLLDYGLALVLVATVVVVIRARWSRNPAAVRNNQERGPSKGNFKTALESGRAATYSHPCER